MLSRNYFFNYKNIFLGIIFVLVISCAGANSDSATETSSNSDTTGSLSLALPFPIGESYEVTQGYGGAFSHSEKCSWNSLDFDMPENAEIASVANGRVVALREDSNLGGPNESYSEDANFLVIDYGDDVFGYYAHLCQDCALVEVGEMVEQGQVIARVGSTGFATGPHLHFEMRSWTTNCSVAYGFRDVLDADGIAQEGEIYSSQGADDSAQEYVEAGPSEDSFSAQGVELDEALPWSFTHGTTVTVTGVVTNGDERVYLFLYDYLTGDALDYSSAEVESDGSFSLEYSVSEDLPVGTYGLGVDATSNHKFSVDSGFYVSVIN